MQPGGKRVMVTERPTLAIGQGERLVHRKIKVRSGDSSPRYMPASIPSKR